MDSLSETFGANLILLLLVAAVWVFLRIQAYMNDPARKQRNELWFSKFESYVAGRYRENGINWRVAILENQFARQDRHHFRSH